MFTYKRFFFIKSNIILTFTNYVNILICENFHHNKEHLFYFVYIFIILKKNLMNAIVKSKRNHSNLRM